MSRKKVNISGWSWSKDWAKLAQYIFRVPGTQYELTDDPEEADLIITDTDVEGVLDSIPQHLRDRTIVLLLGPLVQARVQRICDMGFLAVYEKPFDREGLEDVTSKAMEAMTKIST